MKTGVPGFQVKKGIYIKHRGRFLHGNKSVFFFCLKANLTAQILLQKLVKNKIIHVEFKVFTWLC